ncbi:hypothetical protein ACSQ67_022552 [Phaseolus vulgaris]
MDYNPTVAQIKTQCYLSVGPLALDQALRQGIVDVAMEKDATTVDPSSFSLLVSTPSGLSPSQASSALNPHHSPQTPLTNQHFLFLQVSVAFSDAYDRIPRSDVSLEDTISEIWEQRSLKNNSLFNGKKFRYGGCVLDAGDGSDREPRLCLHLGLTDYRCDLSLF